MGTYFPHLQLVAARSPALSEAMQEVEIREKKKSSSDNRRLFRIVSDCRIGRRPVGASLAKCPVAGIRRPGVGYQCLSPARVIMSPAV